MAHVNNKKGLAISRSEASLKRAALKLQEVQLAWQGLDTDGKPRRGSYNPDGWDDALHDLSEAALKYARAVRPL